ncbi:MAG TPA: sugar phosphate isomerase/epimerase family protein [Bryobacteraceae bacterium]|nr:sugar phosphate isomerase/epimerase family protein [Bryobacteraceae bacterium]
MPRIGIMQGRLAPPTHGRIQCFPRGQWQDEFAYAEAAGLDLIEWIYDLHGAGANPIETDAGVRSMLAVSRTHGVSVLSLCADYYMERPFTTADEGGVQELERHLLWLLTRCERAGIERIVLPFVDASRIQNDLQRERVTRILDRALPFAEASGIELHLETSLPPADFVALLRKIDSPWVKVNYDSGNSSSLGYDPAREFAAYGDRVGSIHIKDRVRGGGTVPLGLGDADFARLFQAICRSGYAGDYILQVARPQAGDEVPWARQNKSFLCEWLKAAQSAPYEVCC